MQRYLSTPLSLLNLAFDLAEMLLAARFVFMFLAANPVNVFITFLYTVTGPLVAPFRGIFRDMTVSGFIVEWSTVIAMLAYGILAMLFVRLILFFTTAASEDDGEITDIHRHNVA